MWASLLSGFGLLLFVLSAFSLAFSSIRLQRTLKRSGESLRNMQNGSTNVTAGMILQKKDRKFYINGSNDSKIKLGNERGR